MNPILTTQDGIITQIIGPVIDVEFKPGFLPDIYTALSIKGKNAVGQEVNVIVEVQ